MTFSEEADPQGPCACWKLKRCKYFARDDIYIIKLEPPIIYNDKCEGRLELEYVAIAARHECHSLGKIETWPVCVYVLKLNESSALNMKILHEEEVSLIKWAELYPSIELKS